ncbi:MULTISPECIES: helix-turn-helix domain-containing protein [unclassified Kribbella]|uniref:helix-turn-helix domain-containing protein n=1 Tax=unclassified Kribbella TaxID=2644121 RepID=UPI00301A7D90
MAGQLAATVSKSLDPARLSQARLLAGLTKAALATEVGVSAAAIGQYESGITYPRPEHLPRIAKALGVPIEFFAAGRPFARVDAGVAHFRSLRSTRVGERAKALAYVEQVWELTSALERHIEFPDVNLPRLEAADLASPATAAQLVREHWGVRSGPFPHLVRTMEIHGVVVTLLPFTANETARIDAFSTSRLPRPIAVLTPDRADDVYRHRFTAAHELGHILLHHDVAPSDQEKEREANAFAAEFLAPAAEILEDLPRRLQMHEVAAISKRWGIPAKSVITRSREVGVVGEPAARRAYQRLNELIASGFVAEEPITSFPGETPSILRRAFQLAEDHGLTLSDLARELCWTPERVRVLLGVDVPRPALRLV